MDKTEAMRKLLESCESCAEAAQLLVGAVELLYSEDADPPAELTTALVALDAAAEALDKLDAVSR